jgi:hypothetical protein
MLLGFTMLMTGTFLLGIVVLIAFSAILTHAYVRHVAATRDAVAAERNRIVAQAAELNQHLCRQIADGNDIRQSVGHWQKMRADLLPGYGWNWAMEVLKRWADHLFADRVQRIKVRAALQGVLGLVIITTVFGSIALIMYNSYAASTNLDTDQTVSPSWPNESIDADAKDLFPDLMGSDPALLPATISPSSESPLPPSTDP